MAQTCVNRESKKENGKKSGNRNTDMRRERNSSRRLPLLLLPWKPLSSKKNVIFKSAADDDVPFPTRCRSALWGLLVLLVHLLIPFFNYLSWKWCDIVFVLSERDKICSFRPMPTRLFFLWSHLSAFFLLSVTQKFETSRTKTKILSSNKNKTNEKRKKNENCVMHSSRGRNNNTPSLLSNSFSFTRAYTKCVRSRNQADRKKKKKRFTHAHTKREKIL